MYQSGIVSATLTVGEVAEDTTEEQDFTVEGLQVGDFVSVNKPSHSEGLGIVNVRVKATNTLAITFMNATAVAIEPDAEAYMIFWMRYERRSDSRVNTQ